MPINSVSQNLHIAEALSRSLPVHKLHLLKRQNYDVGALRSKNWSEFSTEDSPRLDFVFTLCDSAAAESCPVWPGQPMSAHWGLPDPAAAQGNEAERHLAFADTLRLLTNRLQAFTSLPIASLDRLSLQHKLDEIGAGKTE